MISVQIMGQKTVNCAVYGRETSVIYVILLLQSIVFWQRCILQFSLVIVELEFDVTSSVVTTSCQFSVT